MKILWRPEIQHDVCYAAQPPQGGASVEKVLWEGGGILDASPDPTQLGPEAEERRATCQQAGDHGRGGCSQALHELNRAKAGIARVTLGDAIEPPGEGRTADGAAALGHRVDEVRRDQAAVVAFVVCNARVHISFVVDV